MLILGCPTSGKSTFVDLINELIKKESPAYNGAVDQDEIKKHVAELCGIESWLPWEQTEEEKRTTEAIAFAIMQGLHSRGFIVTYNNILDNDMKEWLLSNTLVAFRRSNDEMLQIMKNRDGSVPDVASTWTFDHYDEISGKVIDLKIDEFVTDYMMKLG